MPPRMPIEHETGSPSRSAAGASRGRWCRGRGRRQQREIEDDGAGLLGLRQAPDLDRGAGRAEGPERARTWPRSPGPPFEPRAERARPQIGREHDEYAGEADADRRPAIGAHRLLEDQRRQDHDDQRRGVADRDGVVEGQVGEGDEAREHAAAADDAAQEWPRRLFGADRIDEVALPAQPDQQRHQRESRAEEDELAGRVIGAHDLQARRHQREGEGRENFEEDADGRFHGESDSRTAKQPCRRLRGKARWGRGGPASGAGL